MSVKYTEKTDNTENTESTESTISIARRSSTFCVGDVMLSSCTPRVIGSGATFLLGV